MKVKKERNFNRINDFLENNNGLIFHDVQFNLIISKYINSSFYYFAIYRNKQIVGACPIHEISNHKYAGLMNWGVPYGGWVLEKGQVNIKKAFRYNKIGLLEVLHYWSNPFNENEKEYFINRKANVYETPIIQLQKSSNQIFKEYVSKNTRHNIRRATKKGVVVHEINTKEELNIFIHLKHELDNKVGLNSFSKDLYYDLYDAYFNTGNLKALIAYFDNVPVSGLLLLAKGSIVHAWAAGRKNEIPNSIYQNELLWWNSIEWAIKNSYKYYDLCVVQRDKLPKIAQFKMGFSKRLIQFYSCSKKTIFYRIIRKLNLIK